MFLTLIIFLVIITKKNEVNKNESNRIKRIKC